MYVIGSCDLEDLRCAVVVVHLYGVATISRLLKDTGLFCERAL